MPPKAHLSNQPSFRRAFVFWWASLNDGAAATAPRASAAAWRYNSTGGAPSGSLAEGYALGAITRAVDPCAHRHRPQPPGRTWLQHLLATRHGRLEPAAIIGRIRITGISSPLPCRRSSRRTALPPSAPLRTAHESFQLTRLKPPERLSRDAASPPSRYAPGADARSRSQRAS